MGSDQPLPANDGFTVLSITPTHDPEFCSEQRPAWLPRHARFEGQIGPALRVPGRGWRELSIRLQSGPAYLYGYLPFACAIYVNERPAVLLEFSAELEEQTALVRVPVGERFTITIVSELAGSPARTAHGTDTRELALLFHGASTGRVVNAPRQTAIAVPDAYAALGPSGQKTVTPRPIFVIGAYRSGTSVLTWSLGQHPDIWPIEETGWLAMLANGALAGYKNAASASRSFFDVYGASREGYGTRRPRRRRPPRTGLPGGCANLRHANQQFAGRRRRTSCDSQGNRCRTRRQGVLAGGI